MQAKRALILGVVLGLAALTVSASAQAPATTPKPAGGAQSAPALVPASQPSPYTAGFSGTSGVWGTSGTTPFGGQWMSGRAGFYPAPPHADPTTQKLHAEEASLAQES